MQIVKGALIASAVARLNAELRPADKISIGHDGSEIEASGSYPELLWQLSNTRRMMIAGAGQLYEGGYLARRILWSWERDSNDLLSTPTGHIAFWPWQQPGYAYGTGYDPLFSYGLTAAPALWPREQPAYGYGLGLSAPYAASPWQQPSYGYGMGYDPWSSYSLTAASALWPWEQPGYGTGYSYTASLGPAALYPAWSWDLYDSNTNLRLRFR